MNSGDDEIFGDEEEELAEELKMYGVEDIYVEARSCTPSDTLQEILK